ncbi:Chromatin structure remodeling complex protein sfh1 [Rhodotorula kratochvilovae]
MSQYGYQQPHGAAHPAQHGAPNPIASTSSGAATPSIGGSTRSGRLVKPVKPYAAPVQPPRARSSLNPLKAQQAALLAAQQAGPPQPPQRHPLSLAPGAVPPLTRITGPGNEGKQASFTTLPARMRLGTSTLVQPNVPGPSSSGGGTKETAAAAVGASIPGVAAGTKRIRSTVNYADLENLDDPDEDSDPDAPRKRGASGTPGVQRKRGAAAAAAPQPQEGTPGPKAEQKPEVWGDGKSYLGVLPPGNLVQVQPAKGTKHTACTEDQLEEAAETPGAFIPVQIDLDVDTFKIRDCFVWNVHEKLITPQAFARIFCDDLDIDHSHQQEVSRQIQAQIDEQTLVAQFPLRSEEEEKDDVERDWRVVINLDVQIGTLRLTDRLEWDLTSPLTPELFAASLVQDLGLSASAAPVIAHAIHEELHRSKRSCLELGLLHADEATRARRGAKPLEGVWREWNDAEKFGPKVERLSLDELDKMEAERERANRRAKRDRTLGVSRTAGRPKR